MQWSAPSSRVSDCRQLFISIALFIACYVSQVGNPVHGYAMNEKEREAGLESGDGGWWWWWWGEKIDEERCSYRMWESASSRERNATEAATPRRAGDAIPASRESSLLSRRCRRRLYHAAA